MTKNLCRAGDYHWLAATVTAVKGDQGKAQLHPVPTGGPEIVEFKLSDGGHICWDSEKRQMMFYIGGVHEPISGRTEWGQIRVAFSNDRPNQGPIIGWVNGKNYRDAQMDQLTDPERRKTKPRMKGGS